MKIKLEELKKAIDRISKETSDFDVFVFVDGTNKLIIKTCSALGEGVAITLFDIETRDFPKITKTERL